MKKKTFIVQLLNSKKPSRTSFTQVEDALFYSNDTDASLVFIPHEDTFEFQTAKVVMYNRSDESLVERDMQVTTEDGRKVASYEMPDEIIAHWGDWTAQPVFISGGEIYSGSIVPFSVIRYLMHERPPRLNEVVTITKFIQQSQALVDDMVQEEAQRATQEQERQSAEAVRVQAENERSGKYESYAQQFNDVITDLSEEKDYHSLPEIAGARGGFDTLGERLNDTTAQLAHTMKLNSKVQTVPNLYENATAPISTNNLIHAVVEYVDESFGGHKYWMAATPYTDSNELIENPTIHYSDDGVNWNQPVGVNPLAPNPADTGENNNWHNSDTFLLYRKDLKRMEVWWRRRYRASGDPSSPEVILRRTSLNGTNWTQEEELFRFNNSPSGDQALSPSAIYNYSTNKYECWLMKANANNVAITDLIRFYVADGSGKNWVLQNEFEPAFENELEKSNWRIWHGSVSKTGAYYELVATAGNINNNNGMWAFHATSINGREWTKLRPLLKPKNDSTDSTNIYHISLTKTNDEHVLYYTGIDNQGRWTLNRSAINRFSMADFQMVNEKNTANLETLISQQLNDEITYYTKLGENFNYQKGWSWVDGMHTVNSTTRIALHPIPLPTNGKFEISGFGSGWVFAYFLSDKNFIMHYDSGWKTGKHSFTTDDQESYLFITVRKNIESPLVTGEFESENTNAQLMITASNQILISRIEQVESKVNNDSLNQSVENIKFYLGFSPLTLLDVESGNWTYTGSPAVGNDIIKGESNTRIRTKTPINLMPNKTYNLRGMDDNWRAGFFLLDANNKILLDSGDLNVIKPGWQNDGYTFTTTSDTKSVVFTISKVSQATVVASEYLSLTNQITITSS